MDALRFSFYTLPLLLLCLSFIHPLSLTPPPSASVIGVTYTSPLTSSSTDDENNSSLPLPPQYPQHQRAIPLIVSNLHFGAVRLPHPDPNLIRQFGFTEVSVLLSIPNVLIPSLASNRTLAQRWIYVHVLPFFPRTKISLISVGVDAVPELNFLLSAIQNVHLALRDLGIKKISVSTTFSFVNLVTTAFPPSSATFKETIGGILMRPLLQFLEDTNSSLLVNLYPYNVYRMHSQIPLGFALFQDHNFNFRDDVVTGVRYRNLFDMMVDAVVTSMAVFGHENVPLIVAETGWPSSGGDGPYDADANPAYAELYLSSLVAHLVSGRGTPLRKEGVSQAYIYELNDPEVNLKQGTRNWGVLYPNMTRKYHFDFSTGTAASITISKGKLFLLVVTSFILLCSL
ncbi:Glucan endo-1,3-beta-glucosidase 13 [Linum grandiflorum]